MIGALAPLSPPGWVDAGRQLVAGFEEGVREINGQGGIAGSPLELAIRDTAASPVKAAAAVRELEGLGVVAVAGEYHSVAAQAAAATADELGVPFLCSSAVIDELVSARTDRVARLAPAQSLGWTTFADFLIASGHRRIALAKEHSVYWNAGAAILHARLRQRGAVMLEHDAARLAPASICDRLAEGGATALVLLAGHPEPAASIVAAVRRDGRLGELLIGAPAGQPEFAGWSKRLGQDGTAIPFLRYLPTRLGVKGRRLNSRLMARMGHPPSFVAFEGYDTVLVLAAAMIASGPGRADIAAAWPGMSIEGSRGPMKLSRPPDAHIRQWREAPIQIVDRDPLDPDRFRVLATR